ncbi:MAG: hypothetical protein L6Q83_08795 [Gammaproteobacteria bacterium]|nr:hypothetical protein [Gammaproteobacteria bacterium]
MKRRAAAKKLDALNAELVQLAAERAALEIDALGGEVDETRRRERYFGIPEEGRRRRLIRHERTLHARRQEQRAAAVTYWQAVVDETREKLDDLKNEAPNSQWRRGIWWDLFTVLWILAGAGWLGYSLIGAAIGAALTAPIGWYIMRSRLSARLASIRTGEEVLRAGEQELAQAQRLARQAAAEALFSPDEEHSASPQSNP